MGTFIAGARDSRARPEAVWALLADVEHWPQTFTPHLKAAHLDGPLQVGATGWVETRLPLPRSSFTVTSVDDGRSWGWEGKLLWLSMSFDHRIEALESGCRVTFDVDLDGRLAAIARPLARLVYRPQMERALDLIVRRAETQP